MASASSRIIILNDGLGYFGSDEPTTNVANFIILSLTTLIPFSSDAFNSRTLLLTFSGPYNSLTSANTVDVLPVPDGP